MITFSKATPQDLHTIQSILRSTWQSTYKNIYPNSFIDQVTQEWHSSTHLQHQIQDPQQVVLLISKQQTPVGVLSGSQQTTHFQLDRLYILPTHQQLGIGTHAIQYLKNHFQGSICLYVEVENYKSLNFYFKQGFLITQVLKETHFQLETLLFHMQYST